MPVDRLPQLAQISAEVAASAGSVAVLPLLWRPAHPVASARADGVVARYIEVGPALLGRTLTAPAAARAVLRHEYAHHQLRDVFPSRVLLAAGYVGLALTVPFLVTIWDEGVSASLSALLRLGAVVGVVAAARAAVLRAREFDADLWAAGDDVESMAMALAGESAPPRKFARLTAPFAHHPSPARRDAALREPGRRSGPFVLDAVLAGLTAAIAGPVLSRLVRSWLQSGAPALYAEVIGWAITGTVLGAWLTMVVIRGLVSSREDGRPFRGSAFSWTLGAAVLIGGVVFSRPLLLPVRPLPATLVGITGPVLLAMGLVIATSWLRGVVEWWLMTPMADRAGRWWHRIPILAGAAATGLLLTILASVEFWAQNIDANPELTPQLELGAGEPLTVVSLVLTLAGEWFSLALVGLAFLVPVGLWFMTRLRRDGDQVPLARSVLVGLGGAGVALASFAIFRALDPVSTAHEHGWYATLLTTYASEAIVGGVVAAAAAAVPLLVTRARVPLAALAATVGAVPAAVGAWLILGRPPSLLPHIFRDVVVIAVLGGLLLATVLETLARRAKPVGLTTGVAVAVPLLAAAALIAVGSLATSTRPSLATDDAHFLGRLQRAEMGAGLDRLLGGACSGPVDRSAAPDLTTLSALLTDPSTQPGTPPLRRLNDSLAAAVRICLDATTAAVSAGRATLDPDALRQIDEASQPFLEELDRLAQRQSG